MKFINIRQEQLKPYNCGANDDCRKIKIRLKMIAMERWKYSYDCNQTFQNQTKLRSSQELNCSSLYVYIRSNMSCLFSSSMSWWTAYLTMDCTTLPSQHQSSLTSWERGIWNLHDVLMKINRLECLNVSFFWPWMVLTSYLQLHSNLERRGSDYFQEAGYLRVIVRGSLYFHFLEVNALYMSEREMKSLKFGTEDLYIYLSHSVLIYLFHST